MASQHAKQDPDMSVAQLTYYKKLSEDLAAQVVALRTQTTTQQEYIVYLEGYIERPKTNPDMRDRADSNDVRVRVDHGNKDCATSPSTEKAASSALSVSDVRSTIVSNLVQRWIVLLRTFLRHLVPIHPVAEFWT